MFYGIGDEMDNAMDIADVEQWAGEVDQSMNKIVMRWKEDRIKIARLEEVAVMFARSFCNAPRVGGLVSPVCDPDSRLMHTARQIMQAHASGADGNLDTR